MKRVQVLSRVAVLNGEAAGSNMVISIRPTVRLSVPHDDTQLDAACRQSLTGDADLFLCLAFDDIGVESFLLGTAQRSIQLAGPTFEDVQSAISARRSLSPEALVAVHCEFGRSRSTAIALALLADAHGPGREAEAVADLLRLDVDGKFHPNPRIVRFADTILLRSGRLEAALAEACSRYVNWRDLWRAVESGSAEAHERVRRIFGAGLSRRR